jgi:hypothetical protein
MESPETSDDETKHENLWWFQPEGVVRKLPQETFKRNNFKGLIAAGCAALLAAATVGYLVVDQNPPRVQSEAFGWSEQPSIEGLIAGCAARYHVTPEKYNPPGVGFVPQMVSIDEMPRLQYGTIVPIYGTFYEHPLNGDKRFWTIKEKDVPRVETFLRTMWNGAIVIYYDRYKVPEENLTPFRNLAEDNPELDIYVAPWPVSRPSLPHDRAFVIATWRGEQTCNKVSYPVIREFRDTFPVKKSPSVAIGNPPLAQ